MKVKFEIYLEKEHWDTQLISIEGGIKVGRLDFTRGLTLPFEGVSRLHAVVEPAGSTQVRVVDLGSTGGVLVNGNRVTQAYVDSGARVFFGPIVSVVMTFPASETVVVEYQPPTKKVR